MKKILSVLTALCLPGLLCAQSRTLENHPYFSKVYPLEANGELINVTTGHSAPFIYDFNKDGVMDLLVGEFGEVDYDGIDSGEPHDLVQGRCRIYINHGTDKAPVYKDFQYLLEEGGQPMAVPVTCCISFVPRFVDFNGDGIDDVLSGSYSGEMFYWEGKGNGQFGKRQNIKDVDGNIIIPTESISVEPVDWDGDGDYDLLVSSRMAGNFIYENTGDRRNYKFSERKDIKLQPGKWRWQPLHLFPYDWNGDGLFDLVAGTENGDINLYLNKGEKGKPEFFEMQPLWVNPENPENRQIQPVGSRVKVFMYDYNQDGKDDLLAGDFSCIDEYMREPSAKELQREKKWRAKADAVSEAFFNDPQVRKILNARGQTEDCPGFEKYDKVSSKFYDKIYTQQATYKKSVDYGNVWVFIRK